MLGQRYAYDFVRTDPTVNVMRFHGRGLLRYFSLGVRLEDCFGWGQPIYAASGGTVVETGDGWPERNPVHLVRDLALVLKHALTFDPARSDLRAAVGNYIIIATQDGYAFFAHAQTGSIKVSAGDRVAPGQLLANVGHSGNSTAPHLHFHLMDDRDLRKAKGIPCCFREYEVFEGGVWQRAQNGIPKATDRIRLL